jgi:hypothetical protein
VGRLLVRARRIFGVGLVAGALVLGTSACGSKSDDKEPAVGTEHGNLAPEDVRAPDAEVADGLGKLKDITNDIGSSASSDNNHAKDLQGQIEPIWESIEGTIKANDSNAYLTFEDQFAVIGKAVEQKDDSSAKTAAALVAKTADAYLAAHPGNGASSSPSGSPSPSASPSSTAMSGMDHSGMDMSSSASPTP